MRRLVSCAALAFCVSNGLLQFANAQTGSIQVWDDSIEFPNKAESLKSVDFRNLSYRLGNDTVVLQNGSFSRKDEPFGGINAELEETWLFDVKDGVPRHALVSIYVDTYGGSSSPNGYVLLFEIREGRLVMTQQFRYDAQAPGTGASFNASRTTLTVTGRSDENTPNCCPKHVDVVTFAWRGDRFLPAGYRSNPVSKK